MWSRDLSNFTAPLTQIEEILWREAEYDAAKHLKHLLTLVRSDNPADAVEFQRLITEDKYLWLGMGTIADICFNDVATNREFRAAYMQLAEACEHFGLASIYSRDVLKIFGG